MSRYIFSVCALSLASLLSASVASAKPVTHDEMQTIIKSCFQKFNEAIWMQVAGVAADNDNTLKFDMVNTPGPYTDANVDTVTFVTALSNTSLLKKGATAWNRACQQSLTSSVNDFRVIIDCSDMGKNIPTRRVMKISLASVQPAVLPIISYKKADLELTYDDIGARTPEMDLIKRVRIDKPKMISDKIPLTNSDTNRPTTITANTAALEQCISEPVKDIREF